MPLVGKRKKRSVGSKSESKTVHKQTSSSPTTGSVRSLQLPPPNPSSIGTSSTSAASSHVDFRRQSGASCSSQLEIIDTHEPSIGQTQSNIEVNPPNKKSFIYKSTARSSKKRQVNTQATHQSTPTDRVLRSATRFKLDTPGLGATKRASVGLSSDSLDTKEKRSRLSEFTPEASNTGTCASKTHCRRRGSNSRSSSSSQQQSSTSQDPSLHTTRLPSEPAMSHQQSGQSGAGQDPTQPQTSNSNFDEAASGLSVPVSAAAAAQWLLAGSSTTSQGQVDLAGLGSGSGSGGSGPVLEEAMLDAAGHLQQLLHQGFSTSSAAANFAPRVHQILQRSVTHNIASQFNQLVAQLERSVDNHEKTLLLNEINEMLMLGNEDTLAGVNVKQLVKPLSSLLQEEETGMVVISATRVVYSLLDSLPRSSSQLLDVLPTLLHIISAPNDFIDLKEQAVKAVELISKRHGARIVQEDGVATCLNVIDFLDTGVQRTVLNAVVNCFAQMRREDFARVGPCLSGLALRLRHSEPRTAERVAVAFGKLIEAHRRDAAVLKRIAASPELFPNLQSMLMTTNPPLNRGTYHVIVRMLTTMCSSCPDLAVVLLKDGIAGTLLHILDCISGSTLPQTAVASSQPSSSTSPGKSGLMGAGGSGGGPAWMSEVAVDIVTLCCELLPALPESNDLFCVNTYLYQRKTAVDWQWLDDSSVWRSYLPEQASQIEQAFESHISQVPFVVDNRHYIVYPADMIQYNEETERSRQIRRISPTRRGENSESSIIDARAAWFSDEEEAASRVIGDLLPRLYDVWREASGPAQLRHKCLEAMLRMLYVSPRHILMEVLKQQQLSSHMAQMLGNPEDTKVVVAGLQMTQMMLDRVSDVFGPCCRREGIVYQLESLRRREHSVLSDLPVATSSPCTGSIPVQIQTRRGGRSAKSRRREREGDGEADEEAGLPRQVGPPTFDNVPASPPVGGKHRRSAAPSNSSSSFFSNLNPSRFVRKFTAGASRHKTSQHESPGASGGSGGSDASTPAGGTASGSPSGGSSNSGSVEHAMTIASALNSVSSARLARLENEKAARVRVLNWIVDRAGRLYDLYMSRRRSRGTGGEGSLSQDISSMEASGVTFSDGTSIGIDDDSRQMDVDAEELEDDGQEVMIQLKLIAHSLKQFNPDGTTNESTVAALRSLADMLTGGTDVTPFQLSHSELVSSLSQFLRATESRVLRWDLFCEVFLPSAVSQTRRMRNRVERRRSPRRASNSTDEDITPLSALVSRLLQCVHHDEHFALRGHGPTPLSSGLLHSMTAHHVTCEFRPHPNPAQQSSGSPLPTDTIRAALDHHYRIDLLTKVATIERHLVERIAERQLHSRPGYHLTRAAYRSTPGVTVAGEEGHEVEEEEEDDDDEDDDDSDYEISESMATLSTAGNNPTSNPTVPMSSGTSGTRRGSLATSTPGPSSYSSSGLRLQLILHDHVLPTEMTLLQAIRAYGAPPNSQELQTPLELLTSQTLVMSYRPGVPPTSISSPPNLDRRHGRRSNSSSITGANAKKVRKELGFVAGMPPNLTPFVTAFLSSRELHVSDPSSAALSLLQCLFALSRFAYAGNLTHPALSPLLSPANFASSKLDSKVARQLQDSMALLVGELPRWVRDLAHACPFLFPFETRLHMVQLTELDRPRIFHRLQEVAGEVTEPSHTHSQIHTSERAMSSLQLTKRKVTVPRSPEEMFKSAERTFDQMGNSLHVLEVKFAEEEGTGLGPTLEFYTLVSKEFQRDSYGLWRASGVTDDGFVITPRGLYPQPWGRNTNSRSVRTAKSKFRFLGQLLARAIIDNRPLDLPLSPLMYRWLLGGQYYMTGADLALVDADLHATYSRLYRAVEKRRQIRMDNTISAENRRLAMNSVTVDGASIDQLCLSFVLPGYEHVELTRNGRNEMVRADNLELYLDQMVQWTLIKGVSRQMTALKDGFESVLGCHSLRYLLEEELEAVLCGAETTAMCHAAWEVPALMEVCRCDHGYTLESRPVQNLFLLMSQFTSEERRLFLQFVTGSPRLPVGGFRSLRPPLTIVKHHEQDPDQYLPSVMTCVNYLKLPNYSSIETLRQKLLLAMRDGQMSFSLS